MSQNMPTTPPPEHLAETSAIGGFLGGFVRSLYLGESPRRGLVTGGVGSSVTMATLGGAYYGLHISADFLIFVALFVGMMAPFIYEWLMRSIGIFMDWITGFSKKMPPN